MKLLKTMTAAALLAVSTSALACASCGCSLSSDWESQGLSSGAGLRFDLRYDAVNQSQVRSGVSSVSQWPVAGHEQEQYTHNRYVTASIDYSADTDWGVNLQLPMVLRDHATNGFAFDGSDAGTSSTQSLGDAKVIGRYQGFSPERNFGVQFGLKLPTGSYTQNFSAGALAGQPLDRGLQPGSGTTDVILGAYFFAPMTLDWDYFVQTLAQVPLASREGYKPGNALNVNVGWRYLGFDKWVPQLQVNVRASRRDSGVNASPDDTGGRTVYVSPGATYPVTETVKVYGFVQVPVYQHLNGYQLAPKITYSVGTRFEF